MRATQKKKKEKKNEPPRPPATDSPRYAVTRTSVQVHRIAPRLPRPLLLLMDTGASCASKETPPNRRCGYLS